MAVVYKLCLKTVVSPRLMLVEGDPCLSSMINVGVSSTRCSFGDGLYLIFLDCNVTYPIS